jgi:hypothetical protein
MRATLGDLGLGGMGQAQAVPVDRCLPLHRGAESSEPWSTLGTRTSPRRYPTAHDAGSRKNLRTLRSLAVSERKPATAAESRTGLRGPEKLAPMPAS